MHAGVGLWAGLGLNDPRWRWGAAALLGFQLAYQSMGMRRKADKGDLDLRETIYGLAAALAWKRWQAIPRPRRQLLVDEVTDLGREAYRRYREIIGA